jgi:TolA-binding protein
MNTKSGYINGKPIASDRKQADDWFEDDLLPSSEDLAIFGTVTDYLKGRQDIEDVKNDPALSITDEAVKEMISDYNKNISGNKDNEIFIKGIFAECASEEKMNDEINQIKQEVRNNNLNELTAEWVKDWHEKRQKGGRNPETEEIKDFIASSLKSDDAPVKNIKNENPKGHSRKLFTRYISLSAAAVLGAFILVRTLHPSSDPETLYKSYYEPFKAVSPVTRNAVSHEKDAYSIALEQYRLGDYQTASAGFSAVFLKDTSKIAPRFFMGVAQMETGKYDLAINTLYSISDRSGEYHKEAVWYLGLAYLKTGEKEKASGCFKMLAQSPGFYSDRAEKILRRLK